ncbi:MAG: SAF domain-containing protein [Anaerolineaceae bacterium]|nr:SAF domain-containing protein [Anaerolineaceae bacterium]
MAAAKKKSGRIIIIIALIAIVGVVLVYLLLTGSGQNNANSNAAPAPTPTPNVELVQIVVASQTIQRGTIITSDFLTTIEYPKSQMPADTFFESIEDAVGTKAKYTIDSGVPLTTSMVVHSGEGSLASFDVPSGMTAYSIAVSPETAVAYAAQKGDHVMVVGCMLMIDVDTNFQTILPNRTAITFADGYPIQPDGAPSSSMNIMPNGADSVKGRYELETTTNDPLYVLPSEVQRSRLVCQTIIQDAEVLNVGFFPLTSTETTTQATPVVVATVQDTTAGTTTYPGSVTLIVSPQDTVILNYLALSGTTLSLALRGAGDTSVITTDPVTLQYVMDSKNIPSPVKLPYATEPRVDSLLFPTFNDYLVQP